MVTFKVSDLKNMNTELKSFAEFLRLSGATADDIFASRLVSCELITNVIRHGGDEAEFKGVLTADSIKISVSAESLRGVNLSRKIPDVFAESGRGLYIIRCLCHDVKHGESGEIVVEIKRHPDDNPANNG